jgi:hypothetical protein
MRGRARPAEARIVALLPVPLVAQSATRGGVPPWKAVARASVATLLLVPSGRVVSGGPGGRSSHKGAVGLPPARRSSGAVLLSGRREARRPFGPGRPAAPGCLPPPLRTVRAVLPHTAHRHRSPAGKRKRGSHRSAQAIDAKPGCPLVVEAGDPVAALESVLGAGEDREAFVDVAVDR